MNLGKKIMLARREIGLTQYELAKKINFTQTLNQFFLYGAKNQRENMFYRMPTDIA